jgi:hypothetical protein
MSYGKTLELGFLDWEEGIEIGFIWKIEWK